MISKTMNFLIINALFILSFNAAYASPQGAEVAYGSADISQSGSNTNINQHSDKAIINWNSFSIASGEHVNFNQPNSQSVVLNKVTGGSPSEIYGRLTGNGNVFLINQNGLLIGQGASIEVGSFLGSTANISDDDYINGRYLFSGASEDVVNKGDLRVREGGFAALIGKKVYNDGLISAKLGKTVLASGESFLLNFDASGLISIAVDKSISDSYVSNTGNLEGASVIMTAGAASDILAGVVNNSGVIKASEINESGGKIILTGGSVAQSGTIDASGGSVEVSGNTVHVSGLIDTRSVNGETGDFLIYSTDDIVIVKSAPSGSLESDFMQPSGSDVSYVDLNTTQLTNSNVTISTKDLSGNSKGNITVMGGTGSKISGDYNLTLQAAGDISVNNESINTGGILILDAAGAVSSSAELAASNLNISAGEQVSLNTTGKIEGDISGSAIHLASGGNIDVKVNSVRVTASSADGFVKMDNSHTGTVYLDSAKAKTTITYSQYGGDVYVDKSLNNNESSVIINIANTGGNIHTDFDFANADSNNLTLTGKGFYLFKPYGDANVNETLIDRTKNFSLLDIRAAKGSVKSDGKRITVPRLDITASGDIDVATDITAGSFVSSGGDVTVTEKDGIIFEKLSAEKGKVSVETAGDLTIKSIASKDSVDITTSAGVKSDIYGGEQDMTFNFHNEKDNSIYLKNGGNITIESLNQGSIKELSLSSNGQISIKNKDSLLATDKITLTGKNINNGVSFSLKSDAVILNMSDGGVFNITAPKADISGGSFNITLTDGVSFEDLNNDKKAINATYFEANSPSGRVSLKDRASAGTFKVSSASFNFSSFNSSVGASSIDINTIDINTTGDISGTGVLSAQNIRLKAKRIGVASPIFIDAENAELIAAGTLPEEKTINVAAPSYFGAIKSYNFQTVGQAYLNGIPVDKRIYPLVKRAERYEFRPFEDKNIGTGHLLPTDDRKNIENNMITLTLPERSRVSAISSRNGKAELK